MKRLNKPIKLSDFKCYHANQMSEAERNAFERELQKNPFEADALEGLQLLSNEQIDADLQKLGTLLHSKKRRPVWPYWAAAASILVLLLTGVLLNELTNKPITTEVAQQNREPGAETLPLNAEKPEYTDSASTQSKPSLNIELAEAKQKELTAETGKEELKLTAGIEEESDVETFEMAESDDFVVSPIEAPLAGVEKKDTQSLDVALQGQGSGIAIQNAGKTRQAVSRQTVEPRPVAGLVHGKVIDAESGEEIFGVLVTEKGGSNGTLTDEYGNFALQLTNPKDSLLIASYVGMEQTEFAASTDSFTLTRLRANKLALNEVVVIGMGTSKKQETTGSISSVQINDEATSYEAAQPDGGMAVLQNYLDTKTKLDDNYPVDKVVVRIKLKIDKQGQLIDFENLNKADGALFARLCQLLKEGSKWQPANRNGVSVDSDVTLRIVFEKLEKND